MVHESAQWRGSRLRECWVRRVGTVAALAALACQDAGTAARAKSAALEGAPKSLRQAGDPRLIPVDALGPGNGANVVFEDLDGFGYSGGSTISWVNLASEYGDPSDQWAPTDAWVNAGAPLPLEAIVGPSHDGRGAVALFVHTRATNRPIGAPSEVARVVRMSAAAFEAREEPPWVDQEIPIPAEEWAWQPTMMTAVKLGAGRNFLAAEADGTVWVGGRLGLLHLTPGAVPAVELTVPAEDLDATFGIDMDEYPPVPPWTDDPTEPDFYPWQVWSPLLAPDGSVLFLAERATAHEDWGGLLRVVGLLHPDGTVEARLGPVEVNAAVQEEPGHNSWQRLLWHEPSDTAMLWPVRDGQFLAYRYPIDGELLTLNARGLGALLLPVPGVGHGTLPLTASLIARYRCCSGAYLWGCSDGGWPSLFARPDGAVGVHVPADPLEGFNEGTTIFELTIDTDGMDPDGDGLGNAAERSAGTDPYAFDTDGDWLSDRLEALAGTDPLEDDAGIATPAYGMPILYVPSSLVRERLPAALAPPQPNVGLVGAQGPVCHTTDGTCHDARGREVARTDDLPWEVLPMLPQTSQDGSFVMVRTREGLARRFFADGTVELYVGAAELERWTVEWGLGTLTWEGAILVPIDRHLTYLVHTLPGLVVAFVDGEGHEVLSGEGLRCDAGLGPCASDPPSYYAPNRHLGPGGGLPGPAQCLEYEALPLWDLRTDRGTPEVEPLFWHEEMGRLVVGVVGNWESWALAVDPDEPPILLWRGVELAGWTQSHLQDARGAPLGPSQPFLPTWASPTGHGDFVGAFGLFGPYDLQTRRGQVATIFELSGTPLRIWDDTLLTFAPEGGYGDLPVEPGWYELVRYDPGTQPGEALVLRLYTYEQPAGDSVPAWELTRSGPRGGLASVWGQADASLGLVTGMDVDGSGRLCVVDRVGSGGRLIEIEPDATSGRDPILRQPDQPFASAVDCAWDADGNLRVLVADPPQIHVRRGPRGASFELETELEPGAPPQSFVRRTDGEVEVFREGQDGLRGLIRTRSGHRVGVRMPAAGSSGEPEIEVDGEVRGTLLRTNASWIGNPDASSLPGKVHLAERPDGQVIITGYDLYPIGAQDVVQTSEPSWMRYFLRTQVVDPESGLVRELSPDFLQLHALVAVVPGGVATDPWASGPEPDPAEGDGGVDADGGPGAGDTGEDSGCGCRAAGASTSTDYADTMSAVLAALSPLLALVLVRRRGPRRRRMPRAGSRRPPRRG